MRIQDTNEPCCFVVSFLGFLFGGVVGYNGQELFLETDTAVG